MVIVTFFKNNTSWGETVHCRWGSTKLLRQFTAVPLYLFDAKLHIILTSKKVYMKAKNLSMIFFQMQAREYIAEWFLLSTLIIIAETTVSS